MSEPVQACVFDAYGTLFDVHSAVARHAASIGPRASALSALWRQKQLEYSWVRSLMGRHEDFWTLTSEALDYAMAMEAIPGRLRAPLLDAYRTLSAYPEVPDVLAVLADRGVRCAILSNGSPAMLADAVASAGLDGRFEAVLSVESIGIYKPDARVYRLAEDRLGLPARAMAFLSSNPWDAAGAALNGFQVHWVNRNAVPREYGWILATEGRPDLRFLPEAVAPR